MPKGVKKSDGSGTDPWDVVAHPKPKSIEMDRRDFLRLGVGGALAAATMYSQCRPTENQNVSITIPATENWSAVYYSNPIPRSSKSLLALALLFDELHIPGVSFPRMKTRNSDTDVAFTNSLRTWKSTDPELHAYQNLCLWGGELPLFDDFIILPDRTGGFGGADLEVQAGRLLDDTYAEGLSKRAIGYTASMGVDFSDRSHGSALIWPFYQARALQYASAKNLPLISDDLTCIPPFPRHREAPPDAKGLAQQLAIEAVSLVLPSFLSVEPERVAEFRAETKSLVRPFRTEMVKFTAELASAIATGASAKDLEAASRFLAETRVLPALQDLARQLKDPVKPFHRIAIDIGEAAMATASGGLSPALTAGWCILRGTKLASEYTQLYIDREGKKKTGLGFLLKVSDQQSVDGQSSNWDSRDWSCSGSVDIPMPVDQLPLRFQQQLKGTNSLPVLKLFQSTSRLKIWQS